MVVIFPFADLLLPVSSAPKGYRIRYDKWSARQRCGITKGEWNSVNLECMRGALELPSFFPLLLALQVKKGSVTDAMKRTLRQFGNVLG